MPAVQPLVIKDGKATPVDHTFNPAGEDANGVFAFKERVSGIPMGQPTITWSLRAPTKTAPTYKLRGQISVPKVVQITDTSGKSVSSVDYTNLATIEFVFSERSSLEERNDMIAFVSNLPMNAIIKSSLQNVEQLY